MSSDILLDASSFNSGKLKVQLVFPLSGFSEPSVHKFTYYPHLEFGSDSMLTI